MQSSIAKVKTIIGSSSIQHVRSAEANQELVGQISKDDYAVLKLFVKEIEKKCKYTKP